MFLRLLQGAGANPEEKTWRGDLCPSQVSLKMPAPWCPRGERQTDNSNSQSENVKRGQDFNSLVRGGVGSVKESILSLRKRHKNSHVWEISLSGGLEKTVVTVSI